MATAPQSSFEMRSTDLIKKEPLDYGGFGDVYLCYHVTLGQVVLKTLYTGSLRNEESKRSLLEEGNIMASLNHERVVKLLGVIMEDRDCSLVMELLPRGNLLVMLETISVPVSIKGRIISEILEGMVYLTDRRVIHKDIKPENILVDKDFHIKIADLGLATCQTWSKLTKEESRRRSRIGQSAGARGPGTLSYMAPEHLESIHTASTEKSDVYSFAIVVWVILTGAEPYANCPAPLVSSDRSVSVPVEASIEDLHDVQYEPPVESIQTDANVANCPSALDEKLHRELQYHKHGSYDSENQLDPANCLHHNNLNPFLQNHFSTSDNTVRQPEQDKQPSSSVHSWTKAEPVQPTSQAWYHPTSGHYESMNSSLPPAARLPMSASSPSLDQFNQQHPHSHYDRQQSWPVCPVSDTSAPDMTPGRLLSPSKSGLPQDPASVFIQNARGIQIGCNNLMNIRGFEPSQSLSSVFSNPNSYIKEDIQKYEEHAVTEEHLDLLRDNIGSKWKRCARNLGLTSPEIETIEHDYQRDGLTEMVHQMLEHWKMKEGSIGCTIGKLCRALSGNIKVDVIQKMLETCASSSIS
ncbi:hypothetical protein F2P81_000534 [Scophthalmus maximus]|uniref:Receptor-interacting serine/threonine-protein kinase 1 n=1 Tax=Scophthalmus maximus TaxID=52904 RepID=A0A6A4TWH1_SCOMX|nr:hypothetical protein F2P81_000534 [Scophthalmus maximus]